MMNHNILYIILGKNDNPYTCHRVALTCKRFNELCIQGNILKISLINMVKKYSEDDHIFSNRLTSTSKFANEMKKTKQIIEESGPYYYIGNSKHKIDLLLIDVVLKKINNQLELFRSNIYETPSKPLFKLFPLINNDNCITINFTIYQSIFSYTSIGDSQKIYYGKCLATGVESFVIYITLEELFKFF